MSVPDTRVSGVRERFEILVAPGFAKPPQQVNQVFAFWGTAAAYEIALDDGQQPEDAVRF